MKFTFSTPIAKVHSISLLVRVNH